MSTRRPIKVSSSNAREGRSLMAIIDASVRQGSVLLPIYSDLATRFREIVESVHSIEDLTSVVKRDATLIAALVRRAKAASPQSSRSVRTVDEAVSLLGQDVSRRAVDIAVHQALFVPRNERYRRLFGAVWRHAIICAHVAEILSRRKGDASVVDAFSFGLLHDVGALGLLHCTMELEYLGALTAAQVDRDIPAVIAKFHTVFGRLLVRRWAFKDGFLEVAIAHEDVDHKLSVTGPLVLVSLANDISNWIEPYEKAVTEGDLFAHRAAAHYEIDLENMAELRGELAEKLALFDLHLGKEEEW
jgi:HD-like signal output (HDOD) protein